MIWLKAGSKTATSRGHEQCQRSQFQFSPKFVIDCKTKQLIDKSNIEPYVALSYVWSQSPGPISSEELFKLEPAISKAPKP